MNNPQIELNRNSLLISSTHTTFHDKISYNFNILCIIFNFHQINFHSCTVHIDIIKVLFIHQLMY